MKFIHTILTTFLFGFFCTAQTSNKTEKIVWKSYTDSASSFNLQYPSDWFLKLTNEKTAFVLKSPSEGEGDNFLENLNLIVKYAPSLSIYSNEDLAKMSIEGIKKKYTTLIIKSSGKTTWLNKDAWEILYEFSENNFPANIIQKVLIYNDRFFVCTYTAQANKTDVYLEMTNEIFERMSIK
jgi:eukaryotic-like serine/threonine-protein kinase